VLLISSKYEEIWPLAINDMINMSDSTYSRDQILAMEKAILSRLGCVLLISSKYEEIWPLAINDMINMSDSTYSRDQILAMEKAILSRLGWYLMVPTPYMFTVWYVNASLPTEIEMENMVLFFIELGLMDYLVTIRNNPSMLAASAVYAARCTLNKTPAWIETLKHYTGYTEDQLGDCAKSLVSFYASASDNKFNVVYKKYVNPDRGAVACFPPATSLSVVNRHK
nr:G2/mitotic-specific cyclin S13-7-like [Tanacetum cinerariifolium]